jgi:hypothetical protein
MKASVYNSKFFANIDEGSYSSAKKILKLVQSYVQPTSVIDVGCGAGSWLRAAMEVFSLRPENVTGIDGKYTKDRHVNSPFNLLFFNLTRPLRIAKQFDLAICVEVAEHLSIERAVGFVSDLCNLSDVIIFSAAIPGQGGTGHINEQWPEYWRKLFLDQSYLMFDPIREAIWCMNEVAPWYAQNSFIFVSRMQIELCGRLEFCRIDENNWKLKIVHPGIFRLAGCESAGAGRLLRAVPRALLCSIYRRIGRKSN